MELSPGERELHKDHPSWRSILDHYTVGLLIAVAIGAIIWFADTHSHGIIAFVIVLVIVLIYGFARRMSTTYIITTERLHIRRGFLSRDIQQTRLERIQDMSVKQSLLERLFRVGTLDFDTAGGDRDEDFAFKGIDHPERMMHRVDEAVRNAGRQVAAAAPAPAPTQE